MWSVSYGKSAEAMRSALVFDRKFILKSARQRLKSNNLAEIFIRQAVSELRFILKNGMTFRKRRNVEACKAYHVMESQEFEAINARQQWANWRLIPSNLSGHLSAGPVLAIDICCGTGQSTEVLSWYLAPGSRILGIDYSQAFIDQARKRTYVHFEGQKAQVSFRVQSVLDPLCDAEGSRISDASIDLVNSCGAVSCHFDEEATRILAREVARVLKPGGLAAIDSGPAGTPKELLVAVFEATGFRVSHAGKSSFLDPNTQVVFKKG
jgi:SAM-dependent methyltransferase